MSYSISIKIFIKYFQLFQEKFMNKLYQHFSNILHFDIIFNIYFLLLIYIYFRCKCRSRNDYINKVMNEENAKIYAIKYLNTINLSNLSSYKLKLKIDAIVILLCNLNLFIKLCNKTHLHITCISQ